MSGQVVLGPHELEELRDAAADFVLAFDTTLNGLGPGVHRLRAPDWLQRSLAELVACAGAVSARFPPGTAPSKPGAVRGCIGGAHEIVRDGRCVWCGEPAQAAPR